MATGKYDARVTAFDTCSIHNYTWTFITIGLRKKKGRRANDSGRLERCASPKFYYYNQTQSIQHALRWRCRLAAAAAAARSREHTAGEFVGYNNTSIRNCSRIYLTGSKQENVAGHLAALHHHHLPSLYCCGLASLAKYVIIA